MIIKPNVVFYAFPTHYIYIEEYLRISGLIHRLLPMGK